MLHCQMRWSLFLHLVWRTHRRVFSLKHIHGKKISWLVHEAPVTASRGLELLRSTGGAYQQAISPRLQMAGDREKRRRRRLLSFLERPRLSLTSESLSINSCNASTHAFGLVFSHHPDRVISLVLAHISLLSLVLPTKVSYHTATVSEMTGD